MTGLVARDALSPVAFEQKTVVEAIGDANMRTLQKGDVIQLERKVSHTMSHLYHWCSLTECAVVGGFGPTPL